MMNEEKLEIISGVKHVMAVDKSNRLGLFKAVSGHFENRVRNHVVPYKRTYITFDDRYGGFQMSLISLLELYSLLGS